MTDTHDLIAVHSRSTFARIDYRRLAEAHMELIQRASNGDALAEEIVLRWIEVAAGLGVPPPEPTE